MDDVYSLKFRLSDYSFSIFLWRKNIISFLLFELTSWVNKSFLVFASLISLGEGFFFFFVSMPSISITEPLRVIYKQRFPQPQHVLSYLFCKTQICVVNGHAQYKLAWPSPAPSFDLFFSIHTGHKLKLLHVPEPQCSPRSTQLKNILVFKVFSWRDKC